MNSNVAGRINNDLTAIDVEVHQSDTEIEFGFIDNICIDILEDKAVGFYIHYKDYDCGDISTCSFKIKFL